MCAGLLAVAREAGGPGAAATHQQLATELREAGFPPARDPAAVGKNAGARNHGEAAPVASLRGALRAIEVGGAALSAAQIDALVARVAPAGAGEVWPGFGLQRRFA